MSYQPFLSKCKYLDGLKCHKLIWYRLNAKDDIPAVDADTQTTFDYGHWIGEKAKELFPNGVEDSSEMSFQEHLDRSLELLKLRVPVFEVGLIYNNAYARPDILDPVGDDKWDIVEVKCGRCVHDVNYHDVAYQRYCYTNAGLNINRCYILHVKDGVNVKTATPPEKAFEKVDVTDKVNEHSIGIEERIAAIRQVVRLEKCPDIRMGEQCDTPYGCVMKPLCQNINGRSK